MAYKHTFKKKFGQNFLRNQRFAKEMISILDLSSKDIVIEIGPGDGMVTQLLLDSSAKLVIAVEVDYQLIPHLVKKFNEFEKFELINQDILKFQIEKSINEFAFENNKEVIKSALEGNYRIKVVGSLPYNISKSIIKTIIKTWPKVEKMVFILQEEVASDYAAKAPKGSFLGNWIRLYADIKKHKSIPAKQFFPVPKVNGGILEINPKNTKRSPKSNLIEKLIRMSFSSPRKNLKNNLKNSSIELTEEEGRKRASELDLIEFFDSKI